MKRTRRVFDISLKMNIVDEIMKGSKTAYEIAKEYNIPISTVYSWLNKKKQEIIEVNRPESIEMIDVTNAAKEIILTNQNQEKILIKIKNIEIELPIKNFEPIWKVISK